MDFSDTLGHLKWHSASLFIHPNHPLRLLSSSSCELELKSGDLIILYSYLALKAGFPSALRQETRGRVGVHLLLLLFSILCTHWLPPSDLISKGKCSSGCKHNAEVGNITRCATEILCWQRGSSSVCETQRHCWFYLAPGETKLLTSREFPG